MTAKTRVVVIDDNPISRDYVIGHWYAGGYGNCGMAGDGVRGVELILNVQPDVVILDMIMPQLDGLGVLDGLNRSKLEHLPHIICLSAVGQEELIRRAIDLEGQILHDKTF